MKRKNIYALLMVFLVISALIVFRTSDTRVTLVKNDEGSPLERAFYATGAQGTDMYIHAWVRKETGPGHGEELEKIAQEVLFGLMGADSVFVSDKSQGAHHETIRLINQTDTRAISVTAQSIYPLESEGEMETFVMVSVEEITSHPQVHAWEIILEGLLRKYGTQTSITTCLSGWVSGTLEKDTMIQSIRHGFQAADGHITEGVVNAQFASYAGFSKSIDRSVKIGKNNINLNIAMRHNSTDNRTYVTAATPVITREY